MSATLALVLVALNWRIGRQRAVIWRCLMALVLFWLFVWLSPQIYYWYYRLIFDGLPVQSVIGTPPTPFDLIRLIGFSDRHDLSHHGQGVLGWAMALTALWPQRHPTGI